MHKFHVVGTHAGSSLPFEQRHLAVESQKSRGPPMSQSYQRPADEHLIVIVADTFMRVFLLQVLLDTCGGLDPS